MVFIFLAYFILYNGLTRSLLTLIFLFHPCLCLPPFLSTDSAKIYLLHEILSQYHSQTFFLLYVLLIHLRSAINLCLYLEEQSLMNRHGLWMGPFPEKEEVITGYRVTAGKGSLLHAVCLLLLGHMKMSFRPGTLLY